MSSHISPGIPGWILNLYYAFLHAKLLSSEKQGVAEPVAERQ
jgi:hypothetical protein